MAVRLRIGRYIIHEKFAFPAKSLNIPTFIRFWRHGLFSQLSQRDAFGRSLWDMMHVGNFLRHGMDRDAKFYFFLEMLQPFP